MTSRIVVLGGGTGGTLTANRLRRLYDAEAAEITVVDQDDRHVYQPGLLFVPFGLAQVDDIVRPRERQLHDGIGFVEAGVDHVDIEADQVHLTSGAVLAYDVLVVATGARLVPEETEGLDGPGWMENVFTFYTPEGAAALGAALATFDRGRLVVNVVDMPIKCPVAPLEFCFLADWYFTERGVRDQVQITYVTPLDAAFTKPIAAERLGGMLAERGIELITEFNTGEVDGVGGRLVAYDGREVGFDLAAVIPLHGGATYVGRSPGLGDELDFVPTDEHTLQAKAAPNIFVIGDAATMAWKDDRQVPGVAQGAIQSGKYVGQMIRRRLNGEQTWPFQYSDRGDVAIIGRLKGVTNIPWLGRLGRASGFPAWVLWLGIHITYLIGFANRVVVVTRWGWSFFTRGRGSRLITGQPLLPEIEQPEQIREDFRGDA